MRIFLTIALALIAAASYAQQTCVDLIAGQHEDAGNICTEIDAAGNLVITIETENDWTLKEWHIYVGDSEAEVPWKNNPAPGSFAWSGTADDLTLTLTPEQIGLDGWSDGERLLVAAHAVVCLGDREETGWGEGHEIGKNWSMGFYVNICEEEYFDVDGFNATVLSDTATVRVQYNGGNPALPYFTGTVDIDGDGSAELTVPTWCIDLAHTIASGRTYCALTVASTDPIVNTLENILFPENLDLANYLLNTYPIGTVMTDGNVLTAGSIQRAVWTLVYGSARSAGEGPWSQVHLDELLSAAQTADGYIPPCDGVVAVVVYPVNCSSVEAQALIAQALVSEVPAACGTRYVVCE